MEFQLLDRLSIGGFVCLRTNSQIADRTTICTFIERSIKAQASESIFDAINQQLGKHGYFARGGQMIDASIVQAPKQALSKDEKELVRQKWPCQSNGSLPSVVKKIWIRDLAYLKIGVI